MPVGLLLCAVGLAQDWADDEATRFSGVAPDPTAAEARAEWTAAGRRGVPDLLRIEERLHALGASPDEAVLISARLAWGRSQSEPAGTTHRDPGLTVRARRLSDGAVLSEGTVVAGGGTYDLADPDDRARLCTRAHAGVLGPLTLYPVAANARDDRALQDPSVLVVGGGERTAVVDLEPGESATLVEVVRAGRRQPRVRRALTVRRGDRVLTLTEGDVLQRVCLEF